MRVATYGICHNNAGDIQRYLKETEKASLVFIMDIGSTDNSLELLRECEANDPRIKVSEFGNTAGTSVDLSVAKSMLLHMAQNTYVDWCFDFDLGQICALYTSDWFDSLEKAVEENKDVTHFTVSNARLHMVNNNTALDIACTHDQVCIVSGVCRAVYSHPVFPELKPVGETGHTDITITSVHQSPDYGIDLTQQYYTDNRDSQRAVYLLAAQLSYHNHLAPFVPTLIAALNLERDYSVGQTLTICHLLFQETDDIAWLYNALSICPTDQETLYRIAFAFYTDGAYWEAIGFSKQLLAHYDQGSPNLSTYKDPKVVAKTHQLIACALYQIDSVGLIGKARTSIEIAKSLMPDNTDLQTDYATLHSEDPKEDHETSHY